jgi:hypothetical protein
MKIINLLSDARPNSMKIAAIIDATESRPRRAAAAYTIPFSLGLSPASGRGGGGKRERYAGQMEG